MFNCVVTHPESEEDLKNPINKQAISFPFWSQEPSRWLTTIGINAPIKTLKWVFKAAIRRRT